MLNSSLWVNQSSLNSLSDNISKHFSKVPGATWVYRDYSQLEVNEKITQSYVASFEGRTQLGTVMLAQNLEA